MAVPLVSTRARKVTNRLSDQRGSETGQANGAYSARLGVTRGAIDLNLLFVFDVLMQERTLTRAGKRLGLSQPATSHALSRLRQMLHDDLFVRTPEGMRPTSRAEQIIEPVRDALRALTMTLEPDTFDPANTIREFTVTVNNHAARAVVPALVREVGNVAPQISLDIRPIGMRDVLDQLDSGGVDVALSTLADGGERFKCVRIMDDDYVVLLDAARWEAAQDPLPVALLAAVPHITITSTGDDTRFIDEGLEAHGLTRSIATRVPFLSIAPMLVRANRLTVMPRPRGSQPCQCYAARHQGTAISLAQNRSLDDLASPGRQPGRAPLAPRHDQDFRAELTARVSPFIRHMCPCRRGP